MPVEATIFTDNAKLPALVLIHGLGSAGSIWKTLIPQLKKSFTVYTLDLPGHGNAKLHENEPLDPKSLAQSIISMMEREHHVSQMHVAGNSLGGWIALEMGAVAPKNIASITALAPAGLWNQVPKGKYPPSLDARFLAKLSQHFMRTAYRIPLLKAIGYKKITHLWRELSFESCRDSVIAMANSKGYMPTWQEVRGRRFESAIENCVNVSIIFGDYDLTLPEKIAQLKSAAPEHANWIIVENCAHVIMWNYPDLTVDFIKETATIS